MEVVITVDEEIGMLGAMFALMGLLLPYTSKYVIVSTGTINRQLGVAGEMKYMNRGVSYCAICDGMLYKDKEVMVVGAGNSAFEESLYLAKICKKVSIVHRSTSFRASAELIEKVKNTENIKLITDTTVESFNGDTILKSVTLKHLDSKEEYMVDGVFIYIGFIPCTDFLKEFNVLDDAGFIKVNQNCETSVEGLYAVGDCTNHVVKQIGCAVGHGITASNIIIKNIIQYKKDYQGMVKLGSFISIIVLIGITYMFIRHLVLYGDLLGLNTTSYYRLNLN